MANLNIYINIINKYFDILSIILSGIYSAVLSDMVYLRRFYVVEVRRGSHSDSALAVEVWRGKLLAFEVQQGKL